MVCVLKNLYFIALLLRLPSIFHPSIFFPLSGVGSSDSRLLQMSLSPAIFFSSQEEQRSNNSSSNSLQMSPHLMSKAEPTHTTGGNSFWLLVAPISFFLSLPRAYDCRWGLECRSTGKLKASPSHSATASPKQSGTTSVVIGCRTNRLVHLTLHFTITQEQDLEILKLHHLGQ